MLRGLISEEKLRTEEQRKEARSLGGSVADQRSFSNAPGSVVGMPPIRNGPAGISTKPSPGSSGSIQASDRWYTST